MGAVRQQTFFERYRTETRLSKVYSSPQADAQEEGLDAADIWCRCS